VKPGTVGSTAIMRPCKRKPKAGSLGSSNTANVKMTVAESVIQFCTINKKSSVSQIMMFLFSEERRRVSEWVDSSPSAFRVSSGVS
jgi:hypothetical protein